MVYIITIFIHKLKKRIMNYTVSLLTTRPDCQALIDLANSEKGTLEYRKTGLERQHLTATVTSAEIESSLQAVNVQIDGLQSVYATLAEGPYKQSILTAIKKAEYKKFLLEQRRENYGVLALLEKEYDIATVDRSIAETDDFITQLTTRMNELP